VASRTAKPAPKAAPARRTPKRAAPKAAPSRRAAAKADGPARASRRAPDPVSLERPSLLSRVSDDTWGLVLLVASVLVALGTWGDLTGPLGRVSRAGFTALVGGVAAAVPLLAAACGWALARGRGRATAGRLFFGGSLVLVGLAGLAHLASGREAGAPVAELRSAGGLAGAGLGAPLRVALSAWGGSLVLLVLVAGGALVLTGTSVAQAAHGAAVAFRAVIGTPEKRRPVLAPLRRLVGGLRHRLRSKPRPAPDLYDQDAEAAEAIEAGGGAPRARRPKAEAADESATAAGKAKIEVTLPEPVAPTAGSQLAIDLGPAAEPGAWKLPSLSLLEVSKNEAVDTQEIERRGRVLEDALAQHGVATRLVNMTVGPTVTRYELELGPGVKVARVTSLHKDIAYAMAAPDVRIQAPIPGKSAIGVEVPNTKRQVVRVGDVLCSAEAHREASPLTVALGRDISGRPMLANLATFPHVLIAGQTGAGKSSGINVLLASILARATPEQVRLILIDPKRVELGQYNGVPHLLTQVVTNPKKAANALSWAVTEMERRYDLLSEVGCRDITAYNEAWDRGDLRVEPAYEGHEPVQLDRLPFIVVVIDELADLMMVAARDVEESICRLAQMARAVGIHLVIATQRPSVDVITGLIKANIPSRIAFSVSTATDSRVILDQVGAEKLVGRGDMLLLGAASSIASRIQGAWIEARETAALVGHWKKQATLLNVDAAVSEAEILGPEVDAGAGGSLFGAAGSGAEPDDEQALEQAMELVVRSQLGSTSMLQRKLRVGFARAGRLMDLLEQKGVVGPNEGSKARAVLMTVDELEDLIKKRQSA
jgi:S-DNA-T family DNA segregation ATPase FtsK/SpoIIIE